jgi:capsular polysaccharide transport system permease protein
MNSLPDDRTPRNKALKAWVASAFSLARLPRGIFAVAAGFSLLVSVYWLIFASDLYVSEAHVIIQRTELNGSSAPDIGSLLSGVVSSPNASDQLLLRDHLLSRDMLANLDARLELRKHFSDWRRDPFSRIWFDDMPLERFQAYMAGRVLVDYDEYTGVLVIRALAFDPETAHAMGAALVEEGERHMNGMAHALANEQVGFLEGQVRQLSERSMAARRSLLDFQDRNALSSPASAAQTLEGIIGRMESQLSDLQTRRTALLGYLVPASPSVKELDLQIAATRQQIDLEGKRLASPDGNTLNRRLEEYQRLELEAAFAQDLYKTALAALERGRIEAIRTLKKVSVLQAPSRPEYPLEPRRFYNAGVFLLISLLVAGILNLVVVIVRDHRD